MLGIPFGTGGPGLELLPSLGGDEYEGSSVVAVSLATADFAHLDTGDLDEDGLPDVVVGVRSSVAPFVAFGVAGGGLSLAASVGLSLPGQRPRLVDLDGDGHLDIVSVGSSEVAAARGDGAGAFSERQSFPLAGTPRALVAGDSRRGRRGRDRRERGDPGRAEHARGPGSRGRCARPA